MAGLVPAIHVILTRKEDVDARDKPGHDELWDPPDDKMKTPARGPAFLFVL